MSAIIDLPELSADLFLSAQAFFDNASFVNKFTKEQAEDIIVCYIDDGINEQLRWARRSENADAALVKYFPWFNLVGDNKNGDGVVNPNVEFSNHFYVDVLDRIEMRIHDLITQVIPDRTWDIWSMKRVGRTLYLVKGSDYRVMDWERRMKSGEWRR